MTGALPSGAVLLLLLAFAVQSWSAAADRFWGPAHYHAVAPSGMTMTPSAETAHADTAREAGHRHGHRGDFEHVAVKHGAVEHGAVEHVRHQAVHWSHVASEKRAPTFTPNYDVQSGHHQVEGTKHPAQPPASAPIHRHAASSGHRHDRSQIDVVYVEADADQSVPVATATGFESYWSIVPTGIQVVQRRRTATLPESTLPAHMTRRVGPPERPPRT